MCSLATWRISSLLAREKGAFGVFETFRNWLEYKSLETKSYDKDVSLWDGITCMWCNSLWISPVIALFVASNLLEYLVCVLAFSSFSVIIEEMYQYIKGDENG